MSPNRLPAAGLPPDPGLFQPCASLHRRLRNSRLLRASRAFTRATPQRSAVFRVVPDRVSRGHCAPGVLPDRNSHFPACTALTKLAPGTNSGGKTMFNCFGRASGLPVVCAGADPDATSKISITPPAMPRGVLISRLPISPMNDRRRDLRKSVDGLQLSADDSYAISVGRARARWRGRRLAVLQARRLSSPCRGRPHARAANRPRSVRSGAAHRRRARPDRRRRRCAA